MAISLDKCLANELPREFRSLVCCEENYSCFFYYRCIFRKRSIIHLTCVAVFSERVRCEAIRSDVIIRLISAIHIGPSSRRSCRIVTEIRRLVMIARCTKTSQFKLDEILMILKSVSSLCISVDFGQSTR